MNKKTIVEKNVKIMNIAHDMKKVLGIDQGGNVQDMSADGD